jgi:sugar/nucleoside kinase (ribokinase family)
MRHYDVCGLGNALVDIEYHVDVDDLEALGIQKGVMTLVDEARQAAIVTRLGSLECNRGSGGSAANTVIAVSQLGGRGFYFCRVANDEMGRFYIDDLTRAGVTTNAGAARLVPGVTGKCLVLVTRDADRTMNTFLGVSADVSPGDVDEDAIRDSRYLYLEGYLVTSPSSKSAARFAKERARSSHTQVVVSLSDPNLVNYFRSSVDELLHGGVDLLFANEDEAKCVACTDQLEQAVEHLKGIAREFVITRGADGAVVYDGRTLHRIAPVATQAIDTLGAGDMFAGAFLYGVTHGMTHPQAGALAAAAAAKIVASLGPRLKVDDTRAVLERFMATSHGGMTKHEIPKHE